MAYWQDRQKEAIEAERKLDIKVEKEIERIYNAILLDIENAISAFYAKYADKEGLTIDEAKKKVDKFDVQAFKDKAKEYVKNKDFSDKANEELRLYNTAMYVNREELLKAQVMFLATYAAAQSEQTVKANIEDNVYNYLKYQSGILGESVNITQEALDAVVNMKYFGATWSDKLWKNQKALQISIDKMVSRMLLRGRHPTEIIPEIRKKYKERSTYEIRRIVLTEATRARTEAQTLYLKKILGNEGTVEYMAKLDERTSDTCRNLDGTKIKVKDIKPGVNAPPMHPFCRSWLSESFEKDWRDEFFEKRKGKYSLGVTLD
ncbi:minor capsid protein [Staphylococcus sp. IVB6238]|uniref:minor capsid protein n=1 Tax=Staphylococcus sp. IVB6238 TaxID=2989770 RepID=UPI0021D291DF|nr:minor capsid protein [Staphylococcus sp. IVB6238]UXR73305.1 minor capsid protein [Staphylococcus sp. IVB6238]